MGRKGRWFSSVKKALNPESKEKKDQVWRIKFSKGVSAAAPPKSEETNVTPVEKENSKAHSVAVATTANVEKAVPFAAAPVAVQPAKFSKYVGKDKDEKAATKIQTAYRGYLARRALRVLRGLARLKSLMEGPYVKRQAISTLKSMQTLSRVQSQIHSRRIRMLEENQALKKQLLQKHAKELEKMKIGEEWNDSLQSKEQIESRLLNKYESAMRRERALAYAFTHQQIWKNSSPSVNPMFTNPTNPCWGWSWLERWTAAHPWESRKMERQLNNDYASQKSVNHSNGGGEISKSYARYQLNADKFSPPSSQRATSPHLPSHSSGILAKKMKSASPKNSLVCSDDDSKSTVVSVKSERYRRRSSGGVSSVRDDESLASSQAVSSYMVPTQPAKAKSRMQSPLATDNVLSENSSSLGTVKKRLSFPRSPAKPRRHSVPPKLENSLNSKLSIGNGVGH